MDNAAYDYVANNGEKKHPTVSLHYANRDDLHAAYMPFIKNGALFIATSKTFGLGDLINLKIQFMNEPKIHMSQGHVVWVTPAGAQGGMLAGVGVQFDKEEAGQLRKIIDTYLAGMSDRRSDTL